MVQGTEDEAQPLKQLILTVDLPSDRLGCSSVPIRCREQVPGKGGKAGGSGLSQSSAPNTGESFHRAQTCQSSSERLDNLLAL